MFTLVNGSCPLTAVEWANLETTYCKDGGKYHCIPNENGQLGQVCTSPIWIQPNACPIFNTKTQKMGARLCDSRQPDCQIFHDYRSSRAYEYKACISAKEDTKTIAQSTTTEVQTNNIQSSDVTSFVNTPVGIILLVFLIAMLVAANLLGIYFYRRKWRRRNGRFDRAAEYEPDKEKQEETDRLMAPNPCLAPEYEPDKEKQEEMDRLMAPNPCLAAEYEPDKEKQEETDRLMAPNPCLEIQRHRDDKTFYSGTRAAEKGWKVLTNYGVLIVVGLPGAGKTRLGLEMGFNFYGSMINGKYGVCKLAKDLKNLEQEIESDYHTCFFLDDCFETWNYTQTEYESTRNNEIDRLTLIYENHIKKKQVSIILTVDLSTWNKVHRLFMAYTLFDKDHILLVQYTNAEKKEILQRHSTASGLVIGDKSDGSLPEYTNITTKPGSEYITRGKVGKQNQKENTDITEETYDYIISEGTNIASIPDKDVEEILKAESKELGFPEACTLFCHDKALWQKGSKFFEKPMQYLKGRFEGMLGSREAVGKARICTLFYTLLSGGDLYVNNINKKLVDEIGKLCQLDIFSADLIKKSAHDLSGSYLIEIFQDNFVLQHDVTEFVLLSLLHEKNAEMLLRHCPTRVLQRYVRASTYKKFESEMVLIIKPKHTESLAKRLADDSFSDGDCSIYMMDKDFTKYWGKAKKDRPAEAETEC